LPLQDAAVGLQVDFSDVSYRVNFSGAAVFLLFAAFDKAFIFKFI
jgi:hypothetical protein